MSNQAYSQSNLGKTTRTKYEESEHGQTKRKEYKEFVF